MNVTERLMRAGSFNFELVEDVPDSVLAQLRAAIGWTGNTSSWGSSNGHIVVTAARVEATSLTLSQSLYTGRLTDQEGIRSFSGVGLASWIGAEGHPCPIATTATTVTGNLSACLTTCLATGNGISAGTIAATGSFTGTWQYTSPVEMIDTVCNSIGAEWRINPTGTLDANTATSLFANGSVLISKLGGQSGGTPRGLLGSVLAPRISSANRISRAAVVPAGEGVGLAATIATAGGTIAYGLTGAAATLTQLVDSPQATSAEATSSSTAVLALMKDPRFTFDVAVSSDRVRDVVAPGDTVYVWHPEAGVYSTTLVEFRGESTYPVSVRVQRITWPVTKGYGVYLYRNSGTAAVTDLTPYIVWPDKGAQLEVGSGQGTGDQSVLTGQARF